MVAEQRDRPHPTPSHDFRGGELVPGEDVYHRCFDLLLALTSTAHLLYYLACNFLIWYLIEFFCISSSFQTIREEFQIRQSNQKDHATLLELSTLALVCSQRFSGEGSDRWQAFKT